MKKIRQIKGDTLNSMKILCDVCNRTIFRSMYDPEFDYEGPLLKICCRKCQTRWILKETNRDIDVTYFGTDDQGFKGKKSESKTYSCLVCNETVAQDFRNPDSEYLSSLYYVKCSKCDQTHTLKYLPDGEVEFKLTSI